MIAITNRPSAPGFDLAPLDWRPTTISDLGSCDRTIWTALRAGRDAFVATTAGPAQPEFWSRLYVVDEAPSSQFDVLHAVLGGRLQLPGPIASLALHGKGFHGHRGHPWVALRGNLHLCLALQPATLPSSYGIALTALPAVAVVDALQSLPGGTFRPGIKWVNDILIEGRKIAGVITATHMMNDRVTGVVFGIGLNVREAPVVSPTPFVPAVASLNGRIGLADSLWAVLTHMGQWLTALLQKGPDPILAAYRSASVIIGQRVRIWDHSVDDHPPDQPFPPPAAEGVVTDILPDLSIRLAGRKEPISKGRLALVKKPRP